MKPAPFDYAAPSELDEALELLATRDGALALAGGQSLVPQLALRRRRPSLLVDLNGIAELQTIEASNGSVVVGAGVRQRAIERDPLVGEHVPLLAAGTRLIGHYATRARGTIGGVLANADPRAEYPAVVAALDGEIEVACRDGRRMLTVADLAVGPWTTSLAPGELVVSVRLPRRGLRDGFAIREVAPRESHFATAGAAAAVCIGDDGRIEQARVTVFGATDRPLRLAVLERSLAGMRPTADDLAALAREAAESLAPPDDVHASARYRRQVAARLIASVVETAFEGAEARS